MAAGARPVRHWGRWLLLAVLLLAVAGAAAWRALRPQAVDVVRVEPATLVRTLQFSARVATRSRVDVGATITGRVAAVRVREGAQVQAGDVLVELETDEVRAALQQARAAERQAQARMAGVSGTARQAADAAVAQAQAQLRNARADYARNEQLVAQGFVSQARLDDARRAVEVATAQRDAAVAQARATGERGSELEQARAALQLARAATEAAQARLAQARILAPADARVLVRQVEPGQIVQPGRALLSLALEGPAQLVAQVDERFLEQLRVGQRADVVADAYPGERFTARIVSIAPSVDAQRGSIEVKFELPSVPPFLREDLTVSCEVETGRAEHALAVPLAALLADPPAVLVAQGGRAVRRGVQLGLRTLSAAEVTQGLAGGELVITTPAVPAGARVRPRVVPWQPEALARSAPSREDAGTAMGNAIGR